MASKTAVGASEEELKTIEWRKDCLIAAGVSNVIAWELACALDSDLHKMIKAKRAGCDDKTLKRIYGR